MVVTDCTRGARGAALDRQYVGAVRGDKRVLRCARLGAACAHMFHAWNVGAKAAVWFEYVPSKPNPADEPSRELELAGEEWRPAPGVVSLPRVCIFPPLARLDDPRGWTREAAGAAACM